MLSSARTSAWEMWSEWKRTSPPGRDGASPNSGRGESLRNVLIVCVDALSPGQIRWLCLRVQRPVHGRSGVRWFNPLGNGPSPATGNPTPLNLRIGASALGCTILPADLQELRLFVRKPGIGASQCFPILGRPSAQPGA